MAFKSAFVAHASDGDSEKHRCVIETSKYKGFSKIPQHQPSTYPTPWQTGHSSFWRIPIAPFRKGGKSFLGLPLTFIEEVQHFDGIKTTYDGSKYVLM